jgi:Flp pilus assembly protein CpaB
VKLPSRRTALATRQGTIVVAGIAAVAALVILLVFLHNYRNSVSGGGDPATVLVATQIIDKNTTGDIVAQDQLYRTESIREDERQSGVFEDPSDLRGQIATKQIFPGQQLTSDAFTSGSDPVAGELSGTDRGLALSLDNEHGNVGQLSAGSKVDILGGFSAQQSGGSAVPALSYLARDVLVLSADKDSSTGVGSQDNHKVVIRVSDVEASRITAVADNGDVWLIVRPPTNGKESDISAASLQDLVNATINGGG